MVEKLDHLKKKKIQILISTRFKSNMKNWLPLTLPHSWQVHSCGWGPGDMCTCRVWNLGSSGTGFFRFFFVLSAASLPKWPQLLLVKMARTFFCKWFNYSLKDKLYIQRNTITDEYNCRNTTLPFINSFRGQFWAKTKIYSSKIYPPPFAQML